jgi:hypothetical protein
MKKWAFILLVAAGAAGFGGCESHIQPLREVQRVEEWVEDVPGTLPATMPEGTAPAPAPATEPAVASAPATEPATRPGRMVTRVVNPNETTQFIYNANYDNVWRQGMLILREAGFALDRQDYRLGVLTTKALPSNQIIEFWRPQATNVSAMMENTINNQRRYVKLSISKVEGKPEFYEIAVQVIVERETNPEETIAGPIFILGSGFGRYKEALRSDYAGPDVEKGRWVIIGHDPDLERKLMDVLFKRI